MAHPSDLYDARVRSAHTLEDVQAVNGKRASILFTGVIVDYGETSNGAFVRFQPDERFGMGAGTTFIMDLDPFEVVSPDPQ